MSSQHQEPQQSDDVNASDDDDDDDDEPNDTPQRKVSDHPKPELLGVTSPASFLEHVGIDVDAKEEGGVCGGECKPVPSECSRSPSSHVGPAQRAVDGGASPTQERHPSAELEEDGCPRAAGVVLESSGGRFGSRSGPSLGEVVPQPAHHGDRDVGGGRSGGRTDGPRSGNVSHPNASTSQSAQKVPSLQEHTPVQLRREAGENSTGRAGDEQESRGHGQGESLPSPSPTEAEEVHGQARRARQCPRIYSSWVRTGPVEIEEESISSQDETGPQRKVNANLTVEESVMIQHMRMQKQAQAKKVGKEGNLPVKVDDEPTP